MSLKVSHLGKRPFEHGGEQGRRVRSNSIQRKPLIYSIDERMSSVWRFEDREYPVEKIGEGHEHTVWGFKKDAPEIVINGERIPLAEVVLRTFNYGKKNPLSIQKQFQIDQKSYRFLSKHGVPLPKIYVNEEQFVDSQAPNHGGFWLIERMKENSSTAGWKNSLKQVSELSQEDSKLLEFVKRWLTQSVLTNTIIIGSFFPRNVMQNHEGNFCVVDFSLAPPNISVNEALIQSLRAWSDQNGNVLEYLISDMPDDIKAALRPLFQPGFSSGKAN